VCVDKKKLLYLVIQLIGVNVFVLSKLNFFSNVPFKLKS
jgi:hypothetical protein